MDFNSVEDSVRDLSDEARGQLDQLADSAIDKLDDANHSIRQHGRLGGEKQVNKRPDAEDANNNRLM